MTTPTTRLLELLLRHEEAGPTPPDPAELCADCPELLPAFEDALRQLGRLRPFLDAGTVPEAGTPGPPGLPAVPGYDLLERLGAGGMGVVYKAVQRRGRRVVALKMLRAAAGAGDPALARFQTEAEAVARLAHPNIVPIFEIGEHAGEPFFSMEFCPGGSLGEALRAGPLPPRAAAAVVERLARAMQAAHAKGVVHRDLKPANVLLAEDGTPKVADFGLAKKLDEAGVTQTGAVMGTPSYMPPEQARGDREVGPPADVYALGAVLYECLTGRPPFRAATGLETLRQVLHAEPVPVRQLNPAVPRDLETVAHKCLAKDPPRRYASAEALADDLGRFLAGRPVLARPVGAAERAWRWCRRNRAVATLALAVLVSLLVGTAVAWYFAWQAGVETGNATAAAGAARESEDKATAREKLARTALHASRMAEAQALWRERNLLRAEALLAEVPDDFADGWVPRYLADRCRLAGPTLPGVGPVALSADGRALVTVGPDVTVRLRDAATGREKAVVRGHANRIGGLALSADGATVASCDWAGKAQVADAATGTVRRSFRWGDQPLYSIDLAPDGATAAVGDFAGLIRLIDVATGQEGHVLKGHTGHAYSVAFGPDGRQLLSASQDGTARVWDVATGAEVRAFKLPMHGVLHAAWHPGGALVAAAGQDHRVHVWDARTGEAVRTLAGHTNRVNAVAFAPDGKTLYSASNDRQVKAWDVATGAALATLRGHAGEVTGLAIDRAGKCLASVAGEVRLWALDARPETRTFAGHHGPVNAVAADRAGRVASAGLDGRVVVWDPADPAVGQTLAGEVGSVGVVACSPDGTRFLAAGSRGGQVGEMTEWDARTGRFVRPWPALPAGVWRAVYSPDGRWLATLTFHDDRAVTLWDTATRRAARTFAVPGDERCDAVALAGDGATLVGGTSGGALVFWEAATGRVRDAVRAYPTGGVLDLAVSPDGATVACTGPDGQVQLRDAATGRLQRRLGDPKGGYRAVAFRPGGAEVAAVGFERGTFWEVATGQERLSIPARPGSFQALAFRPDGTRLATAGSTGGNAGYAVKVWDADTGKALATYPAPASVAAVAFRPDGGTLLLGGDGLLAAWDRPGGGPVRVLSRNRGGVAAVAFHPAGRLLAAAVGAHHGEPGRLVVWDPDVAAEPREIRLDHDHPAGLAFAPDGGWLAVVGPGPKDRDVRLWDLARGEAVAAIPALRVAALAVAPDGSALVGTGGGQLTVWDRDGRPRFRHEVARRAFGPAVFTRDGAHVVGGVDDDRSASPIRVWDATTGKLVRRLAGHPFGLSALCLSPDGRTLLSGGGEPGVSGEVKLWDLDTGVELLTLAGFGDRVTGICVTPDGRYVVAASADGTVRVWDAPPRPR